jgi:hypothetical protein
LHAPLDLSKSSIMAGISRMIKVFIFVLALIGVGYGVVTNYSWVFSDTYDGQILAVEKVGQVQVAIIENRDVGSLFSYSVKMLIKSKEGKERVVTASAEDRQWAVAKAGECVRARFQPYPPWNLEKGGTYFNARLMEFIRPCPAGFPPPESAQNQAAPPQQQAQPVAPNLPPAAAAPALPPGASNGGVQGVTPPVQNIPQGTSSPSK